MTKPLKTDTLCRLERAAMRFYRHIINPCTYAISPVISRKFFNACAAHAAAKGKRGRNDRASVSQRPPSMLR